MKKKLKKIIWISSSKKDLMELPTEVINDIGYGLFQAQLGAYPDAGKTLSGFGSASVIELKIDHKGDAFRLVYTVKFAEAIFVLNVFKKKSNKGISTPKKEIDLVKMRLNSAQQIYKQLKKDKK